MGTAVMQFPWETTPIGPMSTWPPSLRQAVKLCYSTRFPVMIAWGPELTMIYNDAYRDMLGTDKRLIALGASVRRVWEEVWDDIEPYFDAVVTNAQPTWAVDAPLVVNRSSFEEETYFTFSYSPLFDEAGNVAGVLDIATETTEHVVDHRRLKLIDDLHVAMADHRGDPTSLATLVVDVLTGSPDINRCAFYLDTDDGLVLAATSDPTLIDDVGLDTVERVLASREPAVTSPILTAPLARPHDDSAAGVLVLEGNLLRPFDAAQRSFLMVASSAVGAALSAILVQQSWVDYLRTRAELSELRAQRVRESSLTLQQSMLTPPPSPKDLSIAVRYQPAAEELQIGGDWYDAFETPAGATMLVIGDVTGHDHHAAAAMGQLRGLIRAIAYDTDLSPARVLERTDRAISGLRLGSATMATTVVVRIDPVTANGTHRIQWSNAGHPPPVVVRRDGEVEPLRTANDLLLGITAVDRVDHTTTLSTGDTLFLYTDGLIERRGQPMSESLARLLEALVGAHRLTLDEVCEHVLSLLAPGADADDDVALVLLRPAPGTASVPAPDRGMLLSAGQA
ncbi:SpoIIE family protein phosphatase [Sanguibacter suarezii]|uniref:SpoIIE family protein phosphatase n=1 Tax=Sanguibacter suarezii TaxID=60921 RepID=UPI000A047096|nr:SpoIIE family protein phosphatase [Sanguibacter suarezii]